MATVHNHGFSNFKIITFLIASRVKTTNVHRHTNFFKIDQMIKEISHLTIIIMVALHHLGLGFLKIYFFEQLVSFGELILICVIIQNFSKIGQTVLEISQFFDVQDGRHSPSWILKFLNFSSTITLGSLICIAVPNFTKFGQTVAEISYLTIFKWRLSAILDFLN